MKTQSVDRDVTVSAGETAEFKSSHTGKLVGLLFSGLYENKPQSILRELWSNALDAHAAVGKADVPFDVTFPTVFDSVFRVRDYGPGMSHEMIMTDYIDPGFSSKEETNDEVGKFGIGSKSPFAYTDVYTLISYDGKQARHYSIVDMGKGKYTANLMATTDSTEPTGIEVTFPIDTSDVNAFRRSAQRVSYGFTVKPNVINADEFDGWIDLPVITEGADWKLLSGELEGYGGTAYAKMGCVLYPINVEALDGLTSDERAFLQTTVVIEFPVGDLEITPSRESLSYGRGEPTSESIIKRVRKIVTEVVDGILKDYEQCDTYWSAVLKYNQHMSLSLPSVILNQVRKEAKWNGEHLTSVIQLRAKRDNDYEYLSFCEMSGKALERRSYRFDRYQTKTDVVPGEDTVLIIEDLTLPTKLRTKRVAARIRQYSKDNELKQVIWVKFHGSGPKEAAAMLALDNRLDGVKIIDTSELAEPPKTSSGSGVRAPVQVRQMHRTSYRMYEQRVELSPERMDEGGVYVKLYRNQAQRPNEMRHTGHEQNIVTTLIQLGVLDKDVVVYGVPKTLWKDFEGDEWVCLFDMALETYDEMACAETIVRARAINEVRSNSVLRTLKEKIDPERLSKDSDAVEAVEFFNSTKTEDTSQADALLALTRAVGREDELETIPDEKVKLDYYVELMEAQYPLIDIIGSHWRWSGSKGVDMMTDYIYTCDTAAATIRAQAAEAAA